jgi:hypothetical protein
METIKCHIGIFELDIDLSGIKVSRSGVLSGRLENAEAVVDLTDSIEEMVRIPVQFKAGILVSDPICENIGSRLSEAFSAVEFLLSLLEAILL